MLLRLAPAFATGRALFAAAAVIGSSAGHFVGDHAHAHIPSMVLAFFLLLGTAWRTNNPRVLFAAAVSVQALIHVGGMVAAHVPFFSLQMAAFHATLAVIAWLLMWKFEQLWANLTAAITAVFHAHELRARTPFPLILLPHHAPRAVGTLTLLFSTHIRRGPPVLA